MRRLTKASLICGIMLVPVFAYAEKNDTFSMLNLFGEVFDRVRSDYVEETKDSDLIEAAINGMLTSLDPHSGYMNGKAFKEMQVQTRGEFGGLGIEVTMENGLVKVITPIDDTPAFEAGIKAGDFVSHIDEEPVMGLSLSEAVEKMRGKVDSTVKLTILREDVPEPLEISITRAIIKIKSAKGRAEGDDIIYLRLTQFNEKTTSLMRSGFKEAKKDIKNLRGIILDLRNNPGGLLDQAVSVSDAFLDKGEIVSTRERDPNNTKRYSAGEGDELVPEDVPVVVLINKGSASASEIVAGALQDHKRAIILGTKSFGKGSVQTVIPLPEHGAMRLTTARYYTPSGHSIQAKGIEPDILVEQAKIEVLKNDKFRTEADLRKRLDNLEDLRAAKKALEEEIEDKTKDGKRKKGLRPGEIEASEDFQLQRAIDLLRAVHVYNRVAPAN